MRDEREVEEKRQRRQTGRIACSPEEFLSMKR